MHQLRDVNSCARSAGSERPRIGGFLLEMWILDFLSVCLLT